MLLPVHSSPAKLRRLKAVVEVPLTLGVSKKEDLHGQHHFVQ